MTASIAAIESLIATAKSRGEDETALAMFAILDVIDADATVAAAKERSDVTSAMLFRAGANRMAGPGDMLNVALSLNSYLSQMSGIVDDVSGWQDRLYAAPDRDQAAIAATEVLQVRLLDVSTAVCAALEVLKAGRSENRIELIARLAGSELSPAG